MGLELSQLGRQDWTRGWRNSALLHANVRDTAEQEGEERNAKQRKSTWEICHQKGTGNNVINGIVLDWIISLSPIAKKQQEKAQSFDLMNPPEQV
jgi:hypothetical protein